MSPRTSRVQPGKGSEPVPVAKPVVRRRKATVYDAVAGRVGYESFLSQAGDSGSKNRDTTTTSSLATPADEVLFRRKGAPVRYVEDDIYDAASRLDAVADPNQKLPGSDMLKYIHAYTSAFYKEGTVTKGKLDWKSMDETALLAMGILLEETAKQKLGQNGDLAFIEDRRNDLPTGRKKYWNGERWAVSVVRKKGFTDRIRRNVLLPVSARPSKSISRAASKKASRKAPKKV